MFKKDVQPLSDSMLKGISATIDKLEGVQREAEPVQQEVEAEPVQQEVQESYDKKKMKEEVCPKCECDPCECEDEDEEEMDESSCGKKKMKEEKELDPVNKKAVKKKFDDRKDKDIDNDGEVDDQDKYLHMRRKAISKALAKEEKLDEKMSDAEKKTARSLMRLGDKPRQAVATAKGKAKKDAGKQDAYRKAYEEVELEEAYKTPEEAKAYEAGKKAWRDKKKYETNPNKKGSPEHTAWSKGHNDARAKFVKKYGSNEEKMRYEQADEPASPDEASMAMDQAKFIQYVGKEVMEYLEKGEDFPEWMQNKLSGLHEKCKDMHAVLSGDYEDDMSEARKNAAADLYFDTYSAAVQKARKDAEKQGYEVDEDDWHNQVTTGPGKPGRGKTVRHNIKLTKNGKPVRKGLAIQVYNRDTDRNTYELNSYVS